MSWPSRNRTLTRAVARRIVEVHRELAQRIEARDGAGARELMDGHVRMIRNRRVSDKRLKNRQARGGKSVLLLTGGTPCVKLNIHRHPGNRRPPCRNS